MRLDAEDGGRMQRLEKLVTEILQRVMDGQCLLVKVKSFEAPD